MSHTGVALEEVVSAFSPNERGEDPFDIENPSLTMLNYQLNRLFTAGDELGTYNEKALSLISELEIKGLLDKDYIGNYTWLQLLSRGILFPMANSDNAVLHRFNPFLLPKALQWSNILYFTNNKDGRFTPEGTPIKPVNLCELFYLTPWLVKEDNTPHNFVYEVYTGIGPETHGKSIESQIKETVNLDIGSFALEHKEFNAVKDISSCSIELISNYIATIHKWLSFELSRLELHFTESAKKSFNLEDSLVTKPTHFFSFDRIPAEEKDTLTKFEFNFLSHLQSQLILAFSQFETLRNAQSSLSNTTGSGAGAAASPSSHSEQKIKSCGHPTSDIANLYKSFFGHSLKLKTPSSPTGKQDTPTAKYAHVIASSHTTVPSPMSTAATAEGELPTRDRTRTLSEGSSSSASTDSEEEISEHSPLR